ncbi:MAG: hypothetical protein HYU36_02190 [Planctomycetes bacterium]|nr:hypothetical protein [Planctomycetota bacterium]
MELGLFLEQPAPGPLVLEAVEKSTNQVLLLQKRHAASETGHTLLFQVAASLFRPGDYVFRVRTETSSAEKTIRIVSDVPPTHFLVSMSSPATWEDNIRLGSTFSLVDSTTSQKIDGQGMPVLDPLTASQLQNRLDKVLGAGLMAYNYQMWGGYINFQPFFPNASWNDPAIVETAMQAAELSAQRIRRFPNFISCAGMDETGLGWGLHPSGKLVTHFPDPFQRNEYEGRIGKKLPADPRDLPDKEYLDWCRWRCGIIGRFMANAKTHFQRVPHRIPWGPLIYTSWDIHDGEYPLNASSSDVRNTHAFASWAGVYRMAADLSLEKAGWRRQPLCFDTNVSFWTFNQPPDSLMADVMTNYLLSEGVTRTWYLSFQKAEALGNSIARLRKYGDFFLRIQPEARPVAILYSFTEAALRLKGLGPADSSDRFYQTSQGYLHECTSAWLACLRAGHPADIVIEEEIEQGILDGRKVILLPGLRHPLPPSVGGKLSAFVRAGGSVYLDSTATENLPASERLPFDYSGIYTGMSRISSEAHEKSKADPLTASRIQDRAVFDTWIDKALPDFRAALNASAGLPEVASSEPHVLAAKSVSGEGVYYLVFNDVHRRPSKPDLDMTAADGKADKVFPCISWEAVPGVELTFHGLKPKAAVYIIEGRGWDSTQTLELGGEKKYRGDFTPGEMKMFCALPRPIAGLKVSASWDPRPSRVSVTASAVQGAFRNRIRAAVPIHVTLSDSQETVRYSVNRSTDAAGNYAEAFQLAALNDPSGDWQVRVQEMLSGKEGEANFKVGTRRPERPVEDVAIVQVTDPEWIFRFLRLRKALIAMGDKSAESEGQLAASLAESLRKKGIVVEVRKEGEIARKRAYPRIFPAYELVGGATPEQYRALPAEEQEQRRKPWERMVNWEGSRGYPPQFPDAYQVEENIILIGKDSTSFLVNAIQRGSLLRRVANEYYPGKGRGLVQYVWSPFSLGKDVVLITASDNAGLQAAVKEVVTSFVLPQE